MAKSKTTNTLIVEVAAFGATRRIRIPISAAKAAELEAAAERVGATLEKQVHDYPDQERRVDYWSLAYLQQIEPTRPRSRSSSERPYVGEYADACMYGPGGSYERAQRQAGLEVDPRLYSDDG